jgi:hypothetical protein
MLNWHLITGGAYVWVHITCKFYRITCKFMTIMVGGAFDTRFKWLVLVLELIDKLLFEPQFLLPKHIAAHLEIHK